MVDQWLRLLAPDARSKGLITGWGTNIPHVMHDGQNKQTLLSTFK